MSLPLQTLRIALEVVALLAAAAASPRFRTDGFDAAAAALREAISKSNVDLEREAVQRVVDLGDPRALPLFHGLLIEITPGLRTAETELANLEFEYQRRKEAIDRERAAAVGDDAKLAGVKRSEVGLKEWFDKTLAPARARVARMSASRDSISKGAAALASSLPPEKRKAEIDRLAKLLVQADKPWEERVAAMECFALLGDPQVFPVLWKVAAEARKERKRLLADLPKKEEEFEKERARFYREVEKNNGKYYKGARDLLDKAEREIKELQEKIHAQTRIAEALVRLLPEAVQRLPAANQAKAVSELVAAAKGNDAAARLAAVEILGRVQDPAARECLRSLLTGGDPATRIVAIEAAVGQNDEGALDAILEKCVRDEEWTVRAAALRALAEIRSARSVPALIAAYESEVGRLRDDALWALQDLTGLSMASPSAWKQWWEKSQSGFAPPTSRPARPERGPSAGETGVAFVGIQSSSKNVAFVVDVSGSMNFGMEAEAPPIEGKPTRFAVLKRELEAAIEKLPEGGKFSIVTFSTSVNRWNAQPLPVNAANKQKALDFVRKEMVAGGGTNIYAALKDAFDVAGIGATDRYYRPGIDTIYFLTDGTPSPDTEITDPERLLAYVRERNRLGKITVHVVCLGEADAQFLKRLAEQNGGEFAKP